ncbi:hypothetical protein BDR22DRAFT_884385 [Usnea florida]
MGDPISVTGSVLGSILLGIQVTQSLVNFYNSYKIQNPDLAHTRDMLDSLLEIFQSLEQALSDREFLADEQDLVKNIETSIKNCDDLIYEMQDEVQKFDKTSPEETVAIIKRAGRRATYPFRQSTLQKLDEDIKDVRANISSALDALRLKDYEKSQDDSIEMKDLLDLVRTMPASFKLRDWLKAPDAFIDHHTACAKKQPGSGVWFVKSDQFSRWLIEKDSILWLNGIAGSGKSVLCSTAINFVLRRKRSNQDIGVAFFYFTFNDNSKQDESAMLRALLLQLSNQVQNNNADLTELHNKCPTGAPSSPVLRAYLQRVIQRFDHVYIILDALDESPRSSSREHVLDALETMRNWGLQCLHLLVTSRFEWDIHRSVNLPTTYEVEMQNSGLNLPTTYEVEMQNSGIDKDIRDFISSRLDTDRRLKILLPYRERVQESLAARAKGMFPWVDCQLQTLRSCLTEHHFFIMLSSLPESPDETYERILCNTDSSWIEDVRRMLTMLCFASRPLTVQELIDSVAVETGKSAGLNRKRRLQDFGICEVCCGLVDVFLDKDVSGENGYSGVEDEDASEDGDVSAEILHNDPRTSDLPSTRIAHFSVQEYLKSKRIRCQKAASFGLDSITAHAEIAEICLIYLLEPGLSRAKINQATLKEYPLAEYAATYWYHHYKRMETPTSALDNCVLKLFQNQTSFATWVRLHDVDAAYGPSSLVPDQKHHDRRLEDIPNPIYYASLLGLDNALRALLRFEQEESTTTLVPSFTTTPKGSEQTFSAAGSRGGAMQAASYHGNNYTIQILLDSGSDINNRGIYDDKGSALQVASFQGHEKVVQTLLDRGADINIQSQYHGSALQVASGQGHKEVVEILLNRGADVNAQSGQCGSALRQASESGHEEIVQILLDRGADVNAKSESFGRVIYKASAQGNREVVGTQLDGGADIDARSTRYRSALQEASIRGHKEVVEVLLSRGADVNLQSQRQSTALCLTIVSGHTKLFFDDFHRGDIVRMLLDSGARVSIGRSRALEMALGRDNSDIMQMLLDSMNAEDFDNEWPILSSLTDMDSLDGWDNWDDRIYEMGQAEKIIELLKTRDWSRRRIEEITSSGIEESED